MIKCQRVRVIFRKIRSKSKTLEVSPGVSLISAGSIYPMIAFNVALGRMTLATLAGSA